MVVRGEWSAPSHDQEVAVGDWSAGRGRQKRPGAITSNRIQLASHARDRRFSERAARAAGFAQRRWHEENEIEEEKFLSAIWLRGHSLRCSKIHPNVYRDEFSKRAARVNAGDNSPERRRLELERLLIEEFRTSGARFFFDPTRPRQSLDGSKTARRWPRPRLSLRAPSRGRSRAQRELRACDWPLAQGDADEFQSHSAHLVVNDLGELVS